MLLHAEGYGGSVRMREWGYGLGTDGTRIDRRPFSRRGDLVRENGISEFKSP